MLRSLKERLDAYWPSYLAHHLDRKNRAFHDAGDLCVLAGVATLRPGLMVLGVVAGYGWAFAGTTSSKGANRPRSSIPCSPA